MLHGRIGHPIPRANADALRDVVYAIDGAALVAARDNEISIHHVYQVRLPLALHPPHINLLLLNEAVDELAISDGTDDDGIVNCQLFIVNYGRGRSRHPLYVVAEIVSRTKHTLPVILVHYNRCCLAVLCNAKPILRHHRQRRKHHADSKNDSFHNRSHIDLWVQRYEKCSKSRRILLQCWCKKRKKRKSVRLFG